MPAGKGYSSKSAEDKIKKAHKEGKISAKQMKSLPEALLLGIAKKGDKKFHRAVRKHKHPVTYELACKI